MVVPSTNCSRTAKGISPGDTTAPNVGVGFVWLKASAEAEKDSVANKSV
jgi:hypothetical protein